MLLEVKRARRAVPLQSDRMAKLKYAVPESVPISRKTYALGISGFDSGRLRVPMLSVIEFVEANLAA